MSRDRRTITANNQGYKGMTRAEQEELDITFRKIQSFMSERKLTSSAQFPNKKELTARKNAVIDYFPAALRLFTKEFRDSESAPATSPAYQAKSVTTSSYQARAGLKAGLSGSKDTIVDSIVAAGLNKQSACPTTDRSAILDVFRSAVTFPMNQAPAEAEMTEQSLACAFWLLGYFNSQDLRINSQREEQRQKELSQEKMERSCDSDDDGVDDAASDESSQADAASDDCPQAGDVDGDADDAAGDVYDADEADTPSNTSANISASASAMLEKEIWNEFLSCLPKNVPSMHDEDVPYFSDAVYPEELISRVYHVVRHYGDKESADCARIFREIMSMIDEDTKTRLRTLYYRNANNMMAAGLRLYLQEKAEYERVTNVQVPPQLQQGKCALNLRPTPVPGSPMMNPPSNFNTVDDKTMVTTNLASMIETAKKIMEDPSLSDFKTAALQYQNYEPKHYDALLFTKSFSTLRLCDKSAREQLGYKIVLDEMKSCFFGEPYDLCMAYLLLESEHASILDIDTVTASILAYAHSLLPWDVDEDGGIDADLSVVENSSIDYEPKYIHNGRYTEQQSHKFTNKEPSWNQPYVQLEKYEEPYDLTSEIELSEDDEDWVQAISPRKLNYQQLFYLATGTTLPRENTVSRDVIDYIKAQGATDAVAHEIAAMSVVAWNYEHMVTMSREHLLRSLLEFDHSGSSDDDEKKIIDRIEELAVGEAGDGTDESDGMADMAVSAGADEIERLKKEISTLKLNAQNTEDTLSKVRYNLIASEREKKKLIERHAEERQKMAAERAELVELREFMFALKHGEIKYDDESESDTGVQLPYTCALRIVVFGGHATWLKAIKPMLPNVRFYESDVLSSPEIIRKADVVFFQGNALSHKLFYVLIDEIRRTGTEYHYLRYASARKCALQIVERDQVKME